MDQITIQDLETLALKAGGAVLGLIVFYITRRIILGIGQYRGV